MKSPSGTFSLDQLKEDGYTGPVPLLSTEEAAAARRAYFEAIGQSESTPGPTNARPYGFNVLHRWAHEQAGRQAGSPRARLDRHGGQRDGPALPRQGRVRLRLDRVPRRPDCSSAPRASGRGIFPTASS